MGASANHFEYVFKYFWMYYLILSNTMCIKYWTDFQRDFSCVKNFITERGNNIHLIKYTVLLGCELNAYKVLRTESDP